MPKATEISQEFMICRYSNGIKLLSPEYLQSRQFQSSSIGPIPIKSVPEIMQMPFSVFFFEKDFKVKDFNDVCAAEAGISSKSDIVGHTLDKISNHRREIAKLRRNNNYVIEKNQLRVVKENLNLLNGGNIQAISFKMPWYGEGGDILGVFGCGAVVNPNRLDNIADHFVSIANMFSVLQFN